MAKTSTIYIVYGRCGEYEDREEWTVKAYRSEDAAAAHVEAATARVAELDYKRSYPNADVFQTHMGELDPGGMTDFYGTEYNYFAMDLVE
jgi:hypothetical protein